MIETAETRTVPNSVLHDADGTGGTPVLPVPEASAGGDIPEADDGKEAEA